MESLLVDTRLISLYYHLGNNYMKCCRHNLIIQHFPAATEDSPSILIMGKGCGLSSGQHDKYCPHLLCQQCSSTQISAEGCCWDNNGNSTIRSHQPSRKSHLWWLLSRRLPLITKGKVGKYKLFWQIQESVDLQGSTRTICLYTVKRHFHWFISFSLVPNPTALT